LKFLDHEEQKMSNAYESLDMKRGHLYGLRLIL